MPRILRLHLAAFILLHLAAFILLSACAPAPPAPPATAAPAPVLATLKTAVGEMQFRLGDLPAFLKPSAGDQLRQAGKVITGAGGRAVLATLDGSLLYLPPNTTVAIGDDGAVTLLDGQAWVSAGDDLAVVDTPPGRAALRGALMNVAYNSTDEATTVICVRGLCLLANDAGEALISEGQQASVVGDQPPARSQPAPGNLAALWLPVMPELAALLPTTAAFSARGNLVDILAASTASAASPSDHADEPSEPTLPPTSTPSQTPNDIGAIVTESPPTATVPTSAPAPTTAAPTMPSPASPTATVGDARRIATTTPSATSTATFLPTATPTAARTFTPMAPTPTSTPSASTRGGPQPDPSPTWTLNFIPTPLPASGPSKLGFHVTGNGGAMIEFAAAAQPAVMKGVEEIAFLQGVKAVSPNTVTIGRYVVDQPDIGAGDPAQRAIDFVNEQLPRYLEHAAYVDYWEGWNEVAWPNYEWYGRFEAARACEMQKHGLRAAIGAFSAGTPEPWQFEFFLPAIEAGLRCGAILTLHEYGAPTMYLWWSQGLPGGPWYADRGPLAGRYRWLYRDILIPRGLMIPLAITEAGVDGLVAMGLRPGPVGPGWLEFRGYWMQAGLTEDPAQFYVDQLIWYDSMLRQDNYVIGATIYTVAGGISQQQATYEAGSLAPLLIEYMQALR